MYDCAVDCNDVLSVVVAFSHRLVRVVTLMGW
jgi:hypothetical protein